MNRRRFFLRLFFVYLIIISLFSFFIGALILYKNSELLKVRLSLRDESNLDHMRESSDANFRVALNLIGQILNDSDIRRFIIEDERDYYLITQISKRMSRIIDAFSKVGCTFGIMKNNDSLVILPNGTIERHHFYGNLGFSDDQISQIGKFIKFSNGTDMLFLRPEGDELHGNETFTIVYTSEVNGDNRFICFVTFYKQYWFNLSLYDDSFLLVTHNGRLIDHRTSNPVIDRDSILDFLFTDGRNDTSLPGSYDEEPMEKELYGKTYTLYQRRSRVSQLPGVTYIYGVPNYSWFDYDSSAVKTIMSVVTVLLLVGISVSLIIARHMYKPIQGLVQTFKSFDDSDSSDEFRYIEQAYRRIEETLKDNSISLRMKCVRDLFYGLIDLRELDDYLNRFNIDYLRQGYTIVILELLNFTEMQDSYDKDSLHAITSELRQMMISGLRSSWKCEGILINHRQIGFCLGTKNQDDVKTFFTQAIAGIESKYDFYIVAAIAEPSTDIEAMEYCFGSAMHLLSARFALNKSSVLTSKSVPPMERDIYYYPLELERELIDTVLQGRQKKAMNIVKRVITANLRERDLDKQAAGQFLIALQATVHRILQSSGHGDDKKIYSYATDVLTPGGSGSLLIEELIEKIERLFDRLIDEVSSEFKTTDNEAAQQLVNYIKDNYDKNISLTDLADAFGFSVGYISILFKNEVGSNFKDYLNAYRIRIAKEILRVRDVKIKDIAVQVGILNVNTFIRVFKRYEGISPGEFIKKRDLKK